MKKRSLAVLGCYRHPSNAHKTPWSPVRLLYSLLVFLSLCLPIKGNCELPDTGQTKCYNTALEITCPEPGQPFYGQDGNYQGAQPAYQLSADGLVVTDLKTGLMWQQADDGVVKQWAAATTYCDDLVLGGHSDWRLPSRQELVSIVDYGRHDPAINPVFSFRNSTYWSGSTQANSPDRAWRVNFSLGYASSNYPNNSNYARCVRGGP